MVKDYSNQVTSGKQIIPPRLLIYGIAGGGKSTLASKFVDPIFIQVESGARNINVSKLPQVFDIYEFNEQIEWILKGDHKYRTLVIDTIDELQNLWVKNLCGKGNKESLEEVAGGFGKGPSRLALLFDKLKTELEEINVKRGMTIVLLAHCTVQEIKDPTADNYDKFVPALHKKVWPLFLDWSDATFFYTEKMLRKEISESFGKDKYTATTSGKKVLYTTDGLGFTAKNRFHLPREIPITNDLAELEKDVRGVMNLILENMKNGK